MKNYKYITSIVLAALALTSCDVNNTLPEIEEQAVQVTLETNGLDFSKYVAIGASFTAGFSDGALFTAVQENSFPNILASKFALVGGGAFNQPLMEDNVGGFVANGTVIQPPRLIFNGSAPARLDAVPTTDLTTRADGTSFNNFGIPGAKSFHLTFPGYATLNPYFGRMASAATATVLEDALAQSPTFFTLSEVGGNDVLGFATNGGFNTELGTDAIYQSDPTVSPANYGPNDITNTAVFAATFSGMVTQLTANGAKGVIATVPDVNLLPFFTTVPNNALEIDAATASNLTGFFSAVAGIFTQGAIAQGVPPAQAQVLGAQYAITFSEGKNRWIIDVPVTTTNPLGFRQMTEDELLVLSIDQGALANGYGSVLLTPSVLQVLGKLQAGATITTEEGQMVLAAVNGLDDKDVLDTDELASLKVATDNYNATITTIASASNNVALVDLNVILREAAAGIEFDDYSLTTNLVTGGLVSLDGIHLTSRGYALMANKILEAIDSKFGSNFTKANNGLAKAGNYPTNYSPKLR